MKQILLALLTTASSAALASTYTSLDGQIKFTAVGKPGFLKIKGESKNKGPTGQVTIENGEAKGEFNFDLSSLDTGIDMRNEHMKDNYLEVKKFPSAKLKIEKLKVSAEEMKNGFEKDFEGFLTLHGETKPIQGKLNFQSATSKALARFNVQVSDFKIDVPNYKGITVSEKVEIEVSTNLKKKE